MEIRKEHNVELREARSRQEDGLSENEQKLMDHLRSKQTEMRPFVFPYEVRALLKGAQLEPLNNYKIYGGELCPDFLSLMEEFTLWIKAYPAPGPTESGWDRELLLFYRWPLFGFDGGVDAFLIELCDRLTKGEKDGET